MPRRSHFPLTPLLQVLALVFFGLAVSATAHADPITVTGTATVINGQIFGPSITFNISGQNFTANVTDDGGQDRFMHFGIWPCSRSGGGLLGPCTGANNGYTSNSDLRGPFTLNGNNFNASVIDSLSFTIISPNFVIPPELLNVDALLITAPFTFTGIGIAGPDQFSLQGQGTVTLLLTRQTVFGFTGLFLDRADYVFGAQVAGVTIQSVPEPATLALLFSGLAGAAVRLRKRSKRN